MKVVREEIFGPVVAPTPFDDADLERSPSRPTTRFTDWPPASGPATSARRTSWPSRIRAGTVWINCHNVFDASLALRRLQAVGLGPRDGRSVLNNYTEVKAVTTAL